MTIKFPSKLSRNCWNFHRTRVLVKQRNELDGLEKVLAAADCRKTNVDHLLRGQGARLEPERGTAAERGTQLPAILTLAARGLC